MPNGLVRRTQRYNAYMMKYISVIPVFLFALSLGYLAGNRIAIHPLPMVIQKDTRPLVPIVRIDGVDNGILHGSIVGNARLAIGSIVLTQSGKFALDSSDVLVNTVHVVVPDGMRFVASSRGKKYYPVFSSSASRLSVQNRIYFKTEEEALRAGYQE